MCVTLRKDKASVTLPANSVPLSVRSIYGGPNVQTMRSQMKVATSTEDLLGRLASRVNLEKGSTASSTCLCYSEDNGKSTNRSSAQVWRGPGGKGTMLDHLGATIVGSAN